ncbi:TniQ family protein [Rhizobium sp. CF080]|uniref:TniQ family protein n=1 Tax=Rhizobium sp. (strain CF080) TaxID=1144310 RepID=UPI000271BD22|nr:TniQ family protein [Rhizobium sp. CF080]EUB97521.1 TniQ family protein [Rhizobium sp. CF080]
MKLPVSIPLHDNETPLGFVSRLAAANGYPSLEAFLGCTETNALSIMRGDSGSMALLEAWTGEKRNRLGRFAVQRADEKLHFRLGDAVFGRDHRRGNAHRFCVQCVQQDLRIEEGRKVSRPYVRAWWETKAIGTCPPHGSRITEVACDNNKDDFALFVWSNEHLFANDHREVESRPSQELDRYLIGRIRGEIANPFLDNLEAYVVAGLCKYFGRFLRRYRGAAVSDDGSFETLDDAEYGFNAVKLGEAHISELVSELVLGKSFSVEDGASPMDPITRWLRRNNDVPAYASLVELFQDLAERNMPLGEGQICILPTRRRYRHTVRSASVEYGLREQRIVGLLTKAGLLKSEEATTTKVSFDAELAKPILEAAQDALSLTEAAAILGLKGARLHEIIDAGFLPRVEADRGDLRIYTRIWRQDLIGFQRRLFERAKTEIDLDGYLPIVKVAHRCNCQVNEVVGMILDGQLHGIARSGNGVTFANLFVNLKEAQGKRRLAVRLEIGTNLLSIAEAADLLNTAKYKTYPLVASGVLSSVTRLNRSSRRMQPFIEPKALEDFQRRHISVAEIASVYGTRADVIVRRMELLGIEPSFDPGSRPGRYYWRNDLDKFTFERASA